MWPQKNWDKTEVKLSVEANVIRRWTIKLAVRPLNDGADESV